MAYPRGFVAEPDWNERSSLPTDFGSIKDFCFGILLVGCLSVSGCGIWFVSSAKESGSIRNDNIVPYSDAVQLWTDQERAVFADVSFQAEITGRGVGVMEAVAGIESAEIRAKDVPNYNELRYKYKFPQTVEDELPMAIDPVTEEAYFVNLTVTATMDGGRQSELRVNDVPMLKYGYTYDNQKECRIHQGFYDVKKHRCRFVYEASSICLKVSKEESAGLWELDEGLWGTVGCLPRRSNTLVHYDAATQSVGYTRVFERTFANAKGLSPLAVTIRSAEDPYLIAANLTNGSMDFGSSKAEVSTEGIVMLVLALGIAVPAVVHFYDKYQSSRRSRKYQDFENEAYETEMPGRRTPEPFRRD